MNNTFITRLQFLDKIGFDRAFSRFMAESNESRGTGEQDAFLASLLDDGNDYDTPSVLSAMNFARSWILVGVIPSQSVLARMLCLCLYDDKFVNPIRDIAEEVSTPGWIYRALVKIVTAHFDVVRTTLARDAPVWDFLCSVMREDVLRTAMDPHAKYSERGDECCFLIEGMILYWPLEKVTRVGIDELVTAMVMFCADIGSKSAADLMSIVLLAFPAVAAQLVPRNMRVCAMTSSEVLRRLAMAGMLKVSTEMMPICAKKLVPIVVGDDALTREMVAKFRSSEGVFRLD